MYLQVLGEIDGSGRITLVDPTAPPEAPTPVDLDLEKASSFCQASWRCLRKLCLCGCTFSHIEGSLLAGAGQDAQQDLQVPAAAACAPGFQPPRGVLV